MAKKVLKKKKKHLRLKRGARRTIAALLMVTALIVAAIPAPSALAEGAQSENEMSEGDNASNGDEYQTPQINEGNDAANNTGGGMNVQAADSSLPYFDGTYLWVEDGADAKVALKFRVDDSDNTAAFMGYDYINGLGYTSIDSITSIVIPATVTGPKSTTDDTYYDFTVDQIGSSSCKDMTFLQSIKIEAASVDIGDHAFDGCTSFTGISSGREAVKSIGSYAFANTTAYAADFVVPAAVTTIGSYAFHNSAIGTISFDAGSEMGTISPSAFSLDPSGTVVVDNLSSVNMSECTKLTALGGSTFEGRSKLASVTLSDTLKTFASSEFKDCNMLLEVTMPSALQTIGSNTFSGCSSLKKVKFTSTVFVMDGSESNTFFDCTSLKNIEGLENTQIRIMSNTTFGLTNPAADDNQIPLEEIAFPSTMTELTSGLLLNCRSLTKITLNSRDCSVTSALDGLLDLKAEDPSVDTGPYKSYQTDSNGDYTYRDLPLFVGYAHENAANEEQDLTDMSDFFVYASTYHFLFNDLDNSSGSNDDYYDGTYKVDKNGKLVYINKTSARWAKNISDGTIDIPSSVYTKGVTGIAAFASVLRNYQDDASVTAIDIPSSVTSIDASAFENAKFINEIYI
ncbi:MAG: leucine-rich repeat domain-containing protein, partial [Lachnospiraceae bacterium]|nr:leucine-rich repeat domain-containing protein [Lachnospiraceae bacterium]